MFSKVDYIMVLVTDMRRSVRFYRDLLGLPLKFESPQWTEFQTGSTTLALHPGEKGGERASGARGPVAGTCTIGFSTDDVEAAYRKLQSTGVEFTMLPTRQEQEGVILAVCRDPDGLAITIAQSIR
jgi:lactoylglutathione lyase